MKLLSFSEKKDQQQQEQTLKILRTQEVMELEKKANQNLAKAQADFQSTLATNREKWALELEEKQKMMDEMAKEIEVLEEKKKQALLPVTKQQREIYYSKVENDKIFIKLVKKEEEIEDTKQLLEEKLTEVADREQQVLKEEQSQFVALKGVQLQQEQTRKGADTLYKEKVAFEISKQAEEASLLERKREVFLAETSFKAKTEKYARDMKVLKEWEAQLIDERDTLKRAFARLR